MDKDEAITLLLEAFNKRIFVRSTEFDDKPDWAIRLVPYLAALATLQRDRYQTHRALHPNPVENCATCLRIWEEDQ